MIRIYDARTGEHLGSVTESQLQFLIDQLEEESLEDRDYFINRPTLDWLASEGADPGLISLLHLALGSRDGMEIRWKEA
jgi:processive 1,2-diacylglycerol beta-glucosyltransferase